MSQQCEVCDKISQEIYISQFDNKAYYETDTFSIYIPDKKIMGLTLTYIDSIFKIEYEHELKTAFKQKKLEKVEHL